MNTENIGSYLHTITNPSSWQSPDGSKMSCVITDAGQVNLPSGRVCVADPYMIDPEEHTIKQAFTPGKYPVRLCLASIDNGENSDTRVASAMMVLNENEVVSWTPAQYEGVEPEDDLGEDEEDESRGYGVDHATSCFVSTETLAELSEDEDFEKLSDQLTQAITAADEQNKYSCEVVLNGQNMIAFQSGFGDGFYYNWIGLDSDGQPCMLLTAFDVLADNAD